MTQNEKRFLDGLTDTLESLAEDLGLTDLVDKLKVKNAEADNTEETISRKEYYALRQAYVRLEQEVEKYKVRLRREHEQAVARAESKALESAFKALDALEGALQSLEAIKFDDKIKEQIERGIVLQRDTTLTYLSRDYQVSLVPSVGFQANPEHHHVVSEIGSEKPKGIIVYVIEAGYMRNGTLIREAKVVVAKGE